MTLLRALTVALIGTSSLAMGCSGTADDFDNADAPDLDDPMFSTMAGLHGTGGTNNLSPIPFQALKEVLYNSTLTTFASRNDDDGLYWITNNSNNNTLLSSEDGRKVLKYVVRCAVAANTTIWGRSSDGDFSFTGQGILTTTGGWLSGGLNTDAVDDLYACMLAHLNARGVEVPINLSGPHVRNAAGFDSAFSFNEALWVAKAFPSDSGGNFEFYAWPMYDVAQCSGYVNEMTDRVCGTNSGGCGLNVQGDLSTACNETANGWYCQVHGHPVPAILTRLKTDGSQALYGCK